MNTEPKTLEEAINRISQLEAQVEALIAKLKPFELKQQQDDADAESILRRKKSKPPQQITRMNYGGGR